MPLEPSLIILGVYPKHTKFTKGEKCFSICFFFTSKKVNCVALEKCKHTNYKTVDYTDAGNVTIGTHYLPAERSKGLWRLFILFAEGTDFIEDLEDD